jgi:hypothetical protein
MNASELDFRRANTRDFLSAGVGGKLTHNADILMRASAQDFSDEKRRLAAMYACGNIIERVFWLALGRWTGYFDDALPISAEERGFLIDNAPLLRETKMPSRFQNVTDVLTSSNISIDDTFFRERLSGFRLPGPMREWFPIFRSALIASEYLTESAITYFFLFLQ